MFNFEKKKNTLVQSKTINKYNEDHFRAEIEKLSVPKQNQMHLSEN